MPNERWNDQAIDQLKDRVDDHENELDALRSLPTEYATALVKLETSVGVLLESTRDEKKVNREFRKESRDALNALTRERPDGSREAQPGRLGFTSWLAVVATVVVPIVVAIILQGH